MPDCHICQSVTSNCHIWLSRLTITSDCHIWLSYMTVSMSCLTHIWLSSITHQPIYCQRSSISPFSLNLYPSALSVSGPSSDLGIYLTRLLLFRRIASSSWNHMCTASEIALLHCRVLIAFSNIMIYHPRWNQGFAYELDFSYLRQTVLLWVIDSDGWLFLYSLLNVPVSDVLYWSEQKTLSAYIIHALPTIYFY